MSPPGVATMVKVQWRARRKGIAVWVLGLVAGLWATAAIVAGTYTTQEQIQGYADSVASPALYAINGHVVGIATLGGVIQDEFGFMASFLMPLFGISLIAGSTRREEESGRLEALLAGRIDRRAPVLAALLVAVAAIASVAVGFSVALAVSGVPTSSAILDGASMAGVSLVFAGLSALCAQLFLHSRGVYSAGFAVLVFAYVTRGIGDVTGSWVTWLSPLGWQEKTEPFAAQHWWVLAIPVAAGLLLGAGGVGLAGRRDLGSALWRGGAGPQEAAPWLRHPIGLAAWLHRPSIVGWLLGSVVLAVVMGALTQQIVDAIVANPSLGDAMGASGVQPETAFFAIVSLYLAVIGCGFVVQATATLRHEEAEGRLEPALAGTTTRSGWLGAHTLVIVGGLVLIAAAGSLVFALTAAWSTDGSVDVWPVVRSGLAYLPAELTLAGLALAAFGLFPRAYAVAWAGFTLTTTIAFLGPGLKLADWILDLAPTTHVGNPPLGDIDGVGLLALGAVALLLAGAGWFGFRRRAVPGT